MANDANRRKTYVGGAWAGSQTASFPFARLIVEPEVLKIKMLLGGELSFKPDQVIGFKKRIGFIAMGYQIHHNVSNYTGPVIFWFWGKPGTIERMINSVGFHPQATGKIDSSDDVLFRLFYIMGLVIFLFVLGIFIYTVFF